LPIEQSERLASELALGMDEEVLEEANRMVGLSLVEVEVETLTKRVYF
jgi:hypothetical protein